MWSTRASGQGVENYSGGRYAGNWGKVIHGERGEVEGGSVNTTLDTGTGTKSGSLVSEDSFQTDRDLEQLSVSLRPGPSLPETHFGNEEPQTGEISSSLKILVSLYDVQCCTTTLCRTWTPITTRSPPRCARLT